MGKLVNVKTARIFHHHTVFVLIYESIGGPRMMQLSEEQWEDVGQPVRQINIEWGVWDIKVKHSPSINFQVLQDTFYETLTRWYKDGPTVRGSQSSGLTAQDGPELQQTTLF